METLTTKSLKFGLHFIKYGDTQKQPTIFWFLGEVNASSRKCYLADLTNWYAGPNSILLCKAKHQCKTYEWIAFGAGQIRDSLGNTGLLLNFCDW